MESEGKGRVSNMTELTVDEKQQDKPMPIFDPDGMGNPDVHLSEEEQAKAVCQGVVRNQYRIMSLLTKLLNHQDKELVRKLDLRLLPWLSFLYLLRYVDNHCTIRSTLTFANDFLDRTNAGNAKIEGIQIDLKMSDGAYNAALCIFFVAYALLEPLTNVCLKVFRPPVFLSVIMMLWVC